MPLAKASSFFLLATLNLYLMMSFSLSFGSFNNFTTDQSTLIVLKNHITTTNPHNVLAENWSTTTSVCDWIGVTCGSRHHRVTALNISNMGLTGTIPSQLGNLSFLVYLNMSNNNFHGNLPEELSGLRRLRVVDLKNNSLSGFIPPSISNISKLESLILSSNLLQGNIPQQMGNLSNLKVLVAADNRLGGAIPGGIGNLEMLEILNLRHNSFEGIIPQEMSSLRKLGQLVLHNNSLSGPIPVGIFNISTLQFIYMALNKLSGTLPSTMGQWLPNLEILSLHSNSFTGKIPEAISNSSKLKEISLELNKFTGPIPKFFGNLRLLECLHLEGNELTNGVADDPELSFISSLTNCRNLKDFVVSGNPLEGRLPTSIGNLSTSVIRIYASGCKIRGNIPDEVGNLSNLLTLQLSDNDLSGFVPNAFHGSQKLQGLSLDNNKIRGPLPSSLCNLPELSYLYLSGNQISGPIPDCIGNVSSLREIHLDSNRLNSSLPSGMWNLKDLLNLDLSSNSLSGDLPQQLLENLRVAIYIDLSRNGFTGVIPNASASMQSLSFFSLASNKLHGPIPESFGKMISLEWLDLSNNNLSGEMPQSLQGLQSLKYFNVSFNKLRGEIPTGGLFKNFSYLFFLSNDALCGAPQFHVPLCHLRTSNATRRTRLILVISVIIGSLIFMAIAVFLWIMRRGRKEAPSEGDNFPSRVSERFSYKQIQQATDGFSQAYLLGSGSFGSVYRASFEKEMVLAVKVFNLQLEYASKSFETECEMLSSLRHRNLTKVISACSNLDFKALILEYMHNGSLDKWLHSDGYFLDIMQRLDIMIDVASALEYLHYGYLKPVIHCDLKPSNILLDKDMVAHLTDFGITKLLGQEVSVLHTETLATLGYMAPEYGTEGLVSSACDVYSYGVLLMETFTRRRPRDDMFDGELSLRSWINASLPESVTQVVDSNLMREEEAHFIAKIQCVSSIIALAVDCTMESPRDRMNMKTVLTALEKIKVHFTAMLG